MPALVSPLAWDPPRARRLQQQAGLEKTPLTTQRGEHFRTSVAPVTFGVARGELIAFDQDTQAGSYMNVDVRSGHDPPCP